MRAPSLRRRWYASRQSRLRQPVVSVGNLAVGGRGKTPIVAHLARLLVAAGERPSILSRGYGRRRVDPGVVVVSEGAGPLTSIDRSGDEPMMLARSLEGAPVLVAEDRRLAGALAERALGATVHLLDDGFQHLALARDVDLVLVKPDDLTDRVMPFGRLRESPRTLTAADAVIVDGPLGDVERPPSVAGFSLTRSLGEVRGDDGERWAPDDGPVVALAGIAEPSRFIDLLATGGWSPATVITVADHHRYGRRDVWRLAAAVDEAGARGVVTTAKDVVRLSALAPLPMPLAVATLEVTIDPDATFRPWLFERVREARG